MTDTAGPLSLFVGRRGLRYSEPSDWRELILDGRLRREDDIASKRGDDALERSRAVDVPELRRLFDEIDGIQPDAPPLAAAEVAEAAAASEPWSLPEARAAPTATVDPWAAPPARAADGPVRVHVRRPEPKPRDGAGPNPLAYALSPLRRYARFQGRSRRAEFWWYTLAYFAAAFVATRMDGGSQSSPLLTLFILATLLPTLAVGVRRLHDVSRSGWWILFYLIPFVGGLLLLPFFVAEGTPGDNRFGPSPKLDVAHAF